MSACMPTHMSAHVDAHVHARNSEEGAAKASDLLPVARSWQQKQCHKKMWHPVGLSHNYIHHNYIGHNCIGHNYIGPRRIKP